MQIALLAVFILGVPVHLMFGNTTFFILLTMLFIFGFFYQRWGVSIVNNIEIALLPEHPENLDYKYGNNGRSK